MRNPGDINILLVNPWIMDFKAYDFWIKPLGLLYIASILEKNGYKLSFIDCMDRLHPSVEKKLKFKEDGTGKFFAADFEKPAIYRGVPRNYRIYGISEETFMKEMDFVPSPDLILVTSMMTYWYPGVHRAIQILKNRFPGIPLILGGVYPSLCPGFAARNSGADHVMSRFDPRDFVRMMGELTDSKPSFFPESFLHYPSPAYHLYPRLNYGVVVTSLGCPFRCSYCASVKLCPGFYQKKPGDVVREIINISDGFGTDRFAFYDDALLINAETHLVPILEGLAAAGGDFRFYTPNGLHARFITGNLARLMKAAGFRQLRISLESSDENFLKQTGGKVTAGETAKAANILLNAGFDRNEIGIYLLMGIPGQSFEECNRSIDYVHKLGVQIRLSDYSPVPGTSDYEAAKAIFGDELTDPLFHNNTLHHFRDIPFSYEKKKYLREKTFGLNGELLKVSR